MHSEQYIAEREKLRADLLESSGRISLLIREADERSNTIERTRDKELM